LLSYAGNPGVLPFKGYSLAIAVAVLEDDVVLSDRYAEVVSSAPDMSLAWTAGSIAEARLALQSRAPDVLLVDLELPDGNGISIIREMKSAHPSSEAMVVSVFGDEANVVAAIEAGAGGYILKDTLAGSFLSTIRDLHGGGSPISPSIARIVLTLARSTPSETAAAATRATPLAEREVQILGLVAKGFNFNEIARLLDISTNTVRTHIYRIYRKLSVHSRGEAVYEASKLGLLDL
jgi:DNA-binding NarL/FixJ family response regulator